MESPCELNDESDTNHEPRRSTRTKSTDSQGPKWCPKCSRKMRKSDAGLQVCGRCWDASNPGQQDSSSKSQSIRNTRSNLIKPLMSGIPSTRPAVPKGKGRRSLTKRNPLRLTSLVRESSTRPFVFFEGQYFQAGDVVCLTDEDEQLFYAQITGLMQDHNYEKSATVTWLLPSLNSEPNMFDPDTYTLGQEESIPRKLESMQFVMHLPLEHFRPLAAPYRTPPEPSKCGFVWVSWPNERGNFQTR